MVRSLMLAAHKLGLTSAGYAFVSYDMLLDSCNSSTDATENAMVCKAYEGLLDISLYVPSTKEYQNFTKEVRRRMPEPPFYRTMLPQEQVSEPFLLHDLQFLVHLQARYVVLRLGLESMIQLSEKPTR